jgi:hypothetical protein
MRAAAVAGLLLAAAPVAAADPTPPVAFTKVVVDRAFHSEGIAVADVNRDGKPDLLVGDLWYEAPEWKPHPIRKVGDYGDGSKGYSQSFAVWADDLNRDGWPDQIVIGFPGAPCHWYENPQGKPGPWKEHVIWHSACNETPLYTELVVPGKRVLVMGSQPKGKEREGQMAWFAPGADPTQPWEMHPVSEPSAPGKEVPGTFKFSHGLGVGDLNGDERLDVICTGGWWEQPAGAATSGKPWTFHKANIGEAAADMYALDVDGDGKADVVSSSAHNYGIWAHLRTADGGFRKTDLFPKLVSQTHAMLLVDIDGDGVKDLVTGKRWWAHGPKGDADPSAPAVLYWFRTTRSPGGKLTFTPYVIDGDAGMGTQFQATDLNGDGKIDIVAANKKGVYAFLQTAAK